MVVFCRSNIHGRVETSSRLVSPQCVSDEVPIPYGDSSLLTGRSKGRRLGYFNRPVRRLLPYPDSQSFQEVAPFCVKRRGLPVSSDFVRSLSRPLGLHTLSERALPLSSKPGGSHQSLPGRLAHLGRFQALVPGPHQSSAGCVPLPRFSDLRSEIGPLPFSVLHLGMDFVTL
jgi:hypothetical protein